MNRESDIWEVVKYWVEKSDESINAALDEMGAERLSFSVNRIYYACFYAVSAVLLKEKLTFKKHTGVRAAFHKYLVKTRKVNYEHGRLYDELFEARQRGDYIELVHFEKKQVEDWLKRARQFVKALKLLINTDFHTD